MVSGAADDPEIFSGNHQFLYKQIHQIAARVNCSYAEEDPLSMTKQDLGEIIHCLKKLHKPVGSEIGFLHASDFSIFCVPITDCVPILTAGHLTRANLIGKRNWRR
jgi:hypothetical protein